MKTKTTDNKDIANEVELKFKATPHENQLVHWYNFIEKDCLDTYNTMINRKWNDLKIYERALLEKKANYVNNTNIAINTLYAINESYIVELQKMIDKAKSNGEKLKQITENDI